MSYSYSGALTYSAIDHTFEIGELQQNAEDVVITYTVAVNSRGTYNNTATVTGHYGDEVYGEGTLTDSDNATVQVVRPSTPNPPSDPNPPVDIPEEPVPAGPTPGDPEDVLIVEDDIPAAPLPKTGGIDGMILYALGAALIGTGLYFRKRVKAK